MKDKLSTNLKSKFVCYSVKTSVVIGVAIIFYFLRDLQIHPDIPNGCNFYDKILEEYLNNINLALCRNMYLRDISMLLSFLSLDTLFLTFIILYMFYGKLEYVALNFLLFYGIRGILLNVFEFNILENYVFGNPPFYSIITPWGRAADFFYSGHTGCALILSLFILEYGHIKLFYFGLVITFIQGYVMMILKAHYSIDIIVGFIAAHYFYFISADIINTIKGRSAESQHSKQLTKHS